MGMAPDGGLKRLPFALESVLPPVPQSFKCPITHEVMRDPVMTQDGHVYESDAIQEWFRRGHRTSPVTGAVLVNLALLPEVPLRRAIEEYMALRPEIARRELNLRSDLLTLRNVTAALEEELQTKQRILSDLKDAQREEASCASSATPAETSEAAPGDISAGAPRCPGRASRAGSNACDDARQCTAERPSPSPSRMDGKVDQEAVPANGGVAVPAASSAGLPPSALASLPTPCRNGSNARLRTAKQTQHPPPAEPVAARGSSPVTMQRTTKLQGLMQAMRGTWRSGRNSRSRQRCRSRSMEPGEA